MKLSARDKVLGLFLPALLVGVLYLSLFFASKQLQVNRALKSLGEAKNKAPAIQAQLLQTQAQQVALSQKQKKLEDDLKQAQKTWQDAAGVCADARQRPHRIEKLNGILLRRNLRIIEDVESEGSPTKDIQPPPGLESLFKSAPATPKPQMRTVRFFGRYPDVMAALGDLTSTEVVAIPIGLAMKHASLTTPVREWTLVVWI